MNSKKKFTIEPFSKPLLINNKYKLNFGEYLFKDACKKFFIDQYEYEWSDNTSNLKAGDLFVILLANFFRDYNQDGCIQYLEFIKKKIVALKKKNVKIIWLGCGAQTYIESKIFSIDSKIINLLSEIISICGIQKIGVRGKFTNLLLNNYNIPNKILGCPSIFYSKIKIKPPCKTNKPKIIVSPTFGSRVYEEFYTLLKFSRINKTKILFQSEYILSPICNPFINKHEIFSYYETNKANNDDKIIKYLRQFGFDSLDYKYIINNNIQVDSILDWIQKLNEYDFLITSRIHGSIAGLLSGIRVLCIIHDSRTKELCEELKIPHIHLDDLKNNSIQELYHKADQQKFIDNISIQKSKYELFLKEEGIVKE